MNAFPRTTKEALFAEMLGDLDNLLTRVENLPQLIENCEARLSASAATLESAGEKYGQAVAAFTEKAKEELGDFMEKQADHAQAARLAALTIEPRDIQQSIFSRLLGYITISLLTALSTAFLVNWVR